MLLNAYIIRRVRRVSSSSASDKAAYPTRYADRQIKLKMYNDGHNTPISNLADAASYALLAACHTPPDGAQRTHLQLMRLHGIGYSVAQSVEITDCARSSLMSARSLSRCWDRRVGRSSPWGQQYQADACADQQS